MIMGPLEWFFAKNTHQALQTGKRILQIKGLAYQLKFLQGLRRIAVFCFFAVICCVLWVQGTFVIFTHILNQIDKFGFITFDSVLLFGLATFVFSSIGLIWCLRQKRWLEAFGILKNVNNLMSESSSNAKEHPKQNREISNETLVVLVEKVVEQKLAELRVQKNPFIPVNEDRSFETKNRAH